MLPIGPRNGAALATHISSTTHLWINLYRFGYRRIITSLYHDSIASLYVCGFYYFPIICDGSVARYLVCLLIDESSD